MRRVHSEYGVQGCPPFQAMTLVSQGDWRALFRPFRAGVLNITVIQGGAASPRAGTSLCPGLVCRCPFGTEEFRGPAFNGEPSLAWPDRRMAEQASRLCYGERLNRQAACAAVCPLYPRSRYAVTAHRGFLALTDKGGWGGRVKKTLPGPHPVIASIRGDRVQTSNHRARMRRGAIHVPADRTELFQRLSRTPP
jgi:hypothetical protein